MEIANRKKTGCATALGVISMENYKVREILKFSHQILDASISDDDWKQKWNMSVTHYSQAMNICRKKVGDYTVNELERFKELSQ